MPELPEVEVVKESLSRTITGKKIKKVSIKNRNLRYLSLIHISEPTRPY